MKLVTANLTNSGCNSYFCDMPPMACANSSSSSLAMLFTASMVPINPNGFLPFFAFNLLLIDSASFVKKWTGMFTAGLIDWSLAARWTLAIALFLTFFLVQKPRRKPFEICLLSLFIPALEKRSVELLWRLCIK